MGTYFIPDTITRVLHILTHLHFVRTLWDRYTVSLSFPSYYKMDGKFKLLAKVHGKFGIQIQAI